MKTKVKSTPIIASEGLEQSVMGMDNHGRDMATYFLRDKIYSNKIEAVVREYICNAVDEHRKHNVDRPVLVSLTARGMDEAIFSVRDYAEGLSDDGVRKIFGMYFRSTKSESNDSIGGFGVGSKAGHAYTDTFNIISHYNGVKTSYSCMLGAGDNNVPVGHIYKLDSCPTDETGIEINLEVKPAKEKPANRYVAHVTPDVEKFKHEILRFVQFAHSPITAKLFDNVYNTPPQTHSVEVDGFTIAIVGKFTETKTHAYNNEDYENDIVSTSYTPLLKMGDVVYHQLTIPSGAILKDHTMVTVTAPIGSIDIPISREGMEQTERNNRLVERANKALETLADKDSEVFKQKTLLELTDLYLKNCTEKSEDGKYFSYRPHFVYKEYYDTVCSIRDHTHSKLKTDIKDITKEDGKPVLVVIPHNRATDTWIGKVRTWCELNGKQYLCIRENHYSHTTPSDIHDTFNIKHARKLKMPKTGKPQKSGIVWHNAQNIGSFTALQFHNRMREKHQLEVAKDLEEAKKQNEKLVKTAKPADRDALRDFILNPNKTTGAYYRRNSFSYHIGAKGLKKDLAEIGIVEANKGGAMEKKLDELTTLITDRNAQKQFADILLECDWLSDRTKRIIKKKPSKSQRIVDWTEKIKEEDSLRAKVFSQFINIRQYYAKQRELSKQDMKRLLELV